MALNLLVLGNGFDLLCGLGSSYEGFLNSDSYSSIRTELEQVDARIEEVIKHILAEDSAFVFGGCKVFDENTKLGFWDLFFAFPYYYGLKSSGRNWMDFEARIKSIVEDINDEKGDFASLRRLGNESVPRKMWVTQDEGRFMLILFYYIEFMLPGVLEKRFLEKNEKTKLLRILYLDLKKFEHRFGIFIDARQKESLVYMHNAEELACRMTQMIEEDPISIPVYYIDTFNYSDIDCLKNLSEDIWHINGDWESPIFGVDFPKTEFVDDEKFRFTKTFRRLELEGKQYYFPQKRRIQNVVVCGHSLNEQDYNYFFALFNQMGVGSDSDILKEESIVFTYYAHGDVSASEAKQKTLINVLKLFKAYNSEVLGRGDFRLMDILHCSGFMRVEELSVDGLSKASPIGTTGGKWKKQSPDKAEENIR